MSDYTFTPTCQIDHEDLNQIFKETFGYKTDGFFVEVGAYDCKTFSNTYNLSMIGWSGLYIDPMVEFINQGKIYHKDNPDILFEVCAVDSESKTTTLYMHDWATTLCDNVAKIHNCLHNKKEIDCYTLDELLEKHNIDPFFDLLVIDVEGKDLDVLKGFSIKYYEPKLIIVEYQHEIFDEFVKYFDNNGYELIKKDSINLIFRKKK
jgi:FkbM family methyltransferase